MVAENMEGLVVTLNKGVRTIRFNNPKKRNAISVKMYIKISEILNEDSKNEQVLVTIFTGTGEYFSSGADLSTRDLKNMDLEEILDISVKSFKMMVEAILQYPKLLIAVVNGPAIGIGVTLCGLFDVVYASEKATFHTPFVKLGLCIEAAASYVLPIVMGRSKANELLLLGKTFTAQEAYEANLVSKIIKADEIETFVESLNKYGELNAQSLELNKKLITDGFRKEIYDAFSRETAMIPVCQRSDYFMENLLAFVVKSNTSKL